MTVYCDMCPTSVPAVKDCKTIMGPWANLCEMHISTHAVIVGADVNKPVAPEVSDEDYEKFLAAVDKHVESICGLGIEDLPDVVCIRDEFADGASVEDVAERILEEADFF